VKKQLVYALSDKGPPQQNAGSAPPEPTAKKKLEL